MNGMTLKTSGPAAEASAFKYIYIYIYTYICIYLPAPSGPPGCEGELFGVSSQRGAEKLKLRGKRVLEEIWSLRA